MLRSPRLFHRPAPIVDFLMFSVTAVSIVWAPLGVNRLLAVLLILLFWASWSIAHARWHWRRYSSRGKTVCFKRLIVTATIFAFFGCLYVVDYAIAKTGFFSEHPYGINSKGTEVHNLVLYPYTAFHTQPNSRATGDIPLDANPFYDDFDLRSGDHGFFVDFDLDNPPSKRAGEFCVVLIGGSAAQGFGAQSNDHMLYRLLEARLNESCKYSGLQIRVINLAMGSSNSYQNFIMLNRWGHQLQPDLILSFSGFNDMTGTLQTQCDMPLGYEAVWGLTRTVRVTENSEILDDVLQWFPSLNASLFAAGVRVMSAPKLAKKGQIAYWARFQYPGSPTPYELAVKLYVHALQSIKRDFAGIPIVVALQPFREASQDDTFPYQRFFEQAKLDLQSYMNDQWYFIDVHQDFHENDYFGDEYIYDGVHLLNKGQVAATECIATDLLPIITLLHQEQNGHRDAE